jgi:SMC interacting uncharacterized protein involved in chromosome segregation
MTDQRHLPIGQILLASSVAGVISFFASSTTLDRDLSVSIARLESEIKALEVTIDEVKNWKQQTQANRFTSRDAERLENVFDAKMRAELRAMSAEIDELRRRIIVTEQITTGRDLDGVPSR